MTTPSTFVCPTPIPGQPIKECPPLQAPLPEAIATSVPTLNVWCLIALAMVIVLVGLRKARGQS